MHNSTHNRGIRIFKALLSVIFFIPAFLCVVYFAVIVVYAGISTPYCYLWIIMAMVLVLMGYFARSAMLHRGGMPGQLSTFIFTTFFIFAALFAGIMSIVLKDSRLKEDQERTDYTIVMGAKVYDNGVSKTLMYRLEKAMDYYSLHPETVLVLTGGQDQGDSIPEALAMFNYFSVRGIPTGKMLMNISGTSTAELIGGAVDAIEYDTIQKKTPEGPGDKVWDADYVPSISIITSDYHMMRCLRVAENQGIEEPVGIPADSDDVLFIHQCVRESAAIVKDYLMGNFKLNEREIPFNKIMLR